MLVEQGVLGFTLFLILFLFALRPWDRFSGPDLRFRLVLFSTLVVGLMPLSWDYAKPTWFILAMLASQPPRPRDAPASRPLRDAAADYTGAFAAWRGNVRGPNRVPRPSIGGG